MCNIFYYKRTFKNNFINKKYYMKNIIKIENNLNQMKKLLNINNNKDNLSIAIDELRGIIISQFDNLISRLDNMLDVLPSSKDSANE